mgnify:CR=1 FL=1
MGQVVGVCEGGVMVQQLGGVSARVRMGLERHTQQIWADH